MHRDGEDWVRRMYSISYWEEGVREAYNQVFWISKSVNGEPKAGWLDG